MRIHRHSGDRARTELDLARICAFSDGVLAISITLLVLNIDVPSLSKQSLHELPDRRLELAPDLLSSALGFAVIGRFWLVHHRIFGVLNAWDGRLMALNLLFLGFAGLIPFTSDLLALYENQPAAVVCYAAVIAAASLMSWAMVAHARRRNFIKSSELESAMLYGNARALVIPGVFLVSIPVAFLSPPLAECLWVATFFLHPRGRSLSKSNETPRQRSPA